MCDDYIADWRPFVINNPYFNLNHWLGEMDAENSQALIYAKESDEILKKLSLKSSEGGFKITIVWLPEKMHPVCANKLLKLLEEPPDFSVGIRSSGHDSAYHFEPYSTYECAEN